MVRIDRMMFCELPTANWISGLSEGDEFFTTEITECTEVFWGWER